MKTRRYLTLNDRATLRAMKRAGANPCVVAQVKHFMLTGEVKDVLRAWLEK